MIVTMAVLLVATLVGCLRYEMEKVAISNLQHHIAKSAAAIS